MKLYGLFYNLDDEHPCHDLVVVSDDINKLKAEFDKINNENMTKWNRDSMVCTILSIPHDPDWCLYGHEKDFEYTIQELPVV